MTTIYSVIVFAIYLYVNISRAISLESWGKKGLIVEILKEKINIF